MSKRIFKRLFILMLLPVLACVPILADEDDDTSTEEKERKNKEALEKRQAEEKEVKAQFAYSFNDVSDKLVIISCTSSRGPGAGSGFVADMDGKTYLFTNQHVILGADKISFKTAAGKTLKPRGVELSTTRDIARLLLGDGIDGFEINAETHVGAPIGVFGNSEGGGVATELYGKVTSLNAEIIDVSADVVFGNSGSPVLNLNQEVIGIATSVRVTEKRDGETKKRHFCYRLTGNQWMPVNWSRYNDRYGRMLRENEQLVDSIFGIASSWYREPYTRMTADDHPDSELRKWSADHNRMINRIMRLSDKGVATPHELDNTNKQIKQDMHDSAEALSGVCRKRARQMRMMSGQRDMTEFIRGEFESFAYRLEYAAEQIDLYGDKMSTYDYFTFE